MDVVFVEPASPADQREFVRALADAYGERLTRFVRTFGTLRRDRERNRAKEAMQRCSDAAMQR